MSVFYGDTWRKYSTLQKVTQPPNAKAIYLLTDFTKQLLPKEISPSISKLVASLFVH